MPNPDADSERSDLDMDLLTRRMGKYALVVGVAKRARQLREYMRGQPDAAPATAITQALGEILRYRVRVRPPDEEQDEEQGKEEEAAEQPASGEE